MKLVIKGKPAYIKNSFERAIVTMQLFDMFGIITTSLLEDVCKREIYDRIQWGCENE